MNRNYYVIFNLFSLSFFKYHFSFGVWLSSSLSLQHELGVTVDEGVRHLVEQTEGEVSPADKAAAMKAAVEKRAVALRIKMQKWVVVSNPELTNGWLREVRTLNLCPYQYSKLILDKWT